MRVLVTGIKIQRSGSEMLRPTACHQNVRDYLYVNVLDEPLTVSGCQKPVGPQIKPSSVAHWLDSCISASTTLRVG